MTCGGPAARVLRRQPRGSWPHHTRCAATPGRRGQAGWPGRALISTMSAMGARTFRVALACCRPALRGSWRQVLALALLAGLLGVVAHAAYIGLSGLPLMHGKPDNSFLVNSLNGSLDGEYFSQDRATMLA